MTGLCLIYATVKAGRKAGLKPAQLSAARDLAVKIAKEREPAEVQALAAKIWRLSRMEGRQ